MAGYVYVLLNPGLPGKVKIGKTDRRPNDRARELSTTGVPHPFVVAYWRMVSDPTSAEAQLHEMFDAFRVNKDREFFEIEVVRVIDAIRNLDDCGEQSDDQGNRVQPYLYWMAIERHHLYSRIGVSDLPRYDLHSAATQHAQVAWPSYAFDFGRPLFFDLEDRVMGLDILEHILYKQCNGMPGLFCSVTLDELTKVYNGYEKRKGQRLAEIEARRSVERALDLGKRI